MDSKIEAHGWTAVPRSLKVLAARTSPGRSEPIDTSRMPLPNTELAQNVLNYAQENLPVPTFNHSMRVYFYGEAIRRQHFPSWTFSSETLLVTSLLHDIGTVPSNIASTKLSFEFMGGILSLDLLKSLNADNFQAEAICETIIRHQDLGETGYMTTLTAIVHFATVLDNAGMFPELVHPETVSAVVSSYPRLGWTACFAEVVRHECRLKPWANTTRIEGFAAMVEANKVMREFD